MGILRQGGGAFTKIRLIIGEHGRNEVSPLSEHMTLHIMRDIYDWLQLAIDPSRPPPFLQMKADFLKDLQIERFLVGRDLRGMLDQKSLTRPARSRSKSGFVPVLSKIDLPSVLPVLCETAAPNTVALRVPSSVSHRRQPLGRLLVPGDIGTSLHGALQVRDPRRYG